MKSRSLGLGGRWGIRPPELSYLRKLMMPTQLIKWLGSLGIMQWSRVPFRLLLSRLTIRVSTHQPT